MSATARQFVITDDDIANAGAGSYAQIEVDTDYEAVLKSVEDYEKADGAGPGWKFNFSVEGLPFGYWVSHSEASRWKLIEAVNAFDPGFFERRAADGTTPPLDPGQWVGQTVGAHIVLDKKMDTPRKTIDYLFNPSAPEPTVEDMAELAELPAAL